MRLTACRVLIPQVIALFKDSLSISSLPADLVGATIVKLSSLFAREIPWVSMMPPSPHVSRLGVNGFRLIS